MNHPIRLATGAAALLMSVTVTTQSGTSRQQTAAASFARYQTTPVATEAMTTSQYLPMRDGVRLAMGITRPSKEAPGAQPRGPGLLTGAPPRPVEHGDPRFVTPALTSDTEVTGDARVDIWILSTANDGNIFMYLEDGADYRERDRTAVVPAPVVTLYNTPERPSTVSLPIVNP